jgi:hypothetical protein
MGARKVVREHACMQVCVCMYVCVYVYMYVCNISQTSSPIRPVARVSSETKDSMEAK